MSLTYELYDKKRLAVYGDRDKYGKILKGLGARFNPKMRTKPGWNLPVDKESELKKLIDALNKGDEFDNLKARAKSRKDQTKYHRAVSGSEKEDSDDDKEKKKVEEKPRDSPKRDPQPSTPKGSPSKARAKSSSDSSSDSGSEKSSPSEKKSERSEKKPKKHHRHRHHSKERKEKGKTAQKSVLDYYKSFSKRPNKSESELSFSESSDEEDSSEDDFPSPVLPKKKNDKAEYGSIMKKMKDLEKRLKDIKVTKKKH